MSTCTLKGIRLSSENPVEIQEINTTQDQTLVSEATIDFPDYLKGTSMTDTPYWLDLPPNLEKISSAAYTVPVIVSGEPHPDGIQPRFIYINPELEVPATLEDRFQFVEFRLGLTFDFTLELVFRVLDAPEHVYHATFLLEDIVHSEIEWVETPAQLDELVKSLDRESDAEALFKDLKAGIV